MLKRAVRGAIRRLGYDLIKTPAAGADAAPSYGAELRDAQFYKPLFSPWLGYGEFAELFALTQPYTLVSPDRCWVLYCLAMQCLALDGEVWECGVYRGGTARLLQRLVERSSRPSAGRLRLFDTFEGMPDTDPAKDFHRKSDFADTSLAAVRKTLGGSPAASFHQGRIPDTFKPLGSSRIAFAHVDVDIYQSVLDCCAYITPRLVPGGVIVFDDYGFPSCAGARQAVDEFFQKSRLVPLSLPTGQAIVFNG